MTNATMVIARTTPMVKLTCAQNSLKAIIMVEAKPICAKILVRHTIEAATRVVSDGNQCYSQISPQVLPYNALPQGQPCHNNNKLHNELMYLGPTNETTNPIWPLTPQVQAFIEGLVVGAL